MRNYILFIVSFISISVYSQIGIEIENANTKSALTVKSKGNNKGVLIPRMSNAKIEAITDPATGLLVYSTDNNTFCFYNGTKWERIGQSCTIIEDNDQDTKIETDNGSDNDKVKVFANGQKVLVVNSLGIIQNLGSLTKTNGTITINDSYTLPSSDGNEKDVIVTDGMGTLSWQPPESFPGLVAGVVTFPLVNGRELEMLFDKVWYTAMVPWSAFSVTNISFYVYANGTPTFQVGIYNDSNKLLSSGTVTVSTTGFQFATVKLPSAVKLSAGKIYRIGIVDRNRSQSKLLENPHNRDSGLHWYQLRTTPQTLPSTIGSYIKGQKPIWFCLY